MVGSPDEETIRENVNAAVGFAIHKYGIERDVVSDTIIAAARLVGDTRPYLGRVVLSGLLMASDDRRQTARRIIAELPASFADESIGVLVSGINQQVESILEGA
jgi:hypothetical protein